MRGAKTLAAAGGVLLDVLEKKLAGHWMFQTEESRRRLLMCEDCRVRDMFSGEARKGRPGPGAGG